MKKLANYHSKFTYSAFDGTETPVEFQPLSDFFESAVNAEKFIEELTIGRSERKQLYAHIRALLDCAVSDACIQFCD